MFLLGLCTLTGAYALELFGYLPGTIVLTGCAATGAACLKCRFLWPLAFFLLGFAIMGFSARAQLAERLDPAMASQSLAVEARVVNFPTTEGDTVRFVVRPVNRTDLPDRIRLTWFKPEVIPAIGESWQLQLRLKRPRGYANPGGFDFEGWLFRERIGATGYIDSDEGSYRIIGDQPDLITRLRKTFAARVAAILPADDASAVLMAIGVGARHNISRQQWDLYARTGTSHLMAISGLHIGLAAGCAYLLGWALFAPFCTRRNLRDIALLTAIAAAGTYAALSGFAVPSRRALLMACVAGAAILLRRRLQLGPLLAIPCFAIFISNPLAILAPGFKLSFAAVALLIQTAQQHVHGMQGHRWRVLNAALTACKRLGLLQLALLAGLFPLTVLIFGRFSAVAPAINILVLPLFNFVTVPLTLAGALLSGPFEVAGDFLLKGAYHSIRLILQLVKFVGEAGFSSYRTSELSVLFVIIAIIPATYVFLPAGWPGRKLAIVAIIAVLMYKPARPPFLDVGQGLAVVIQTSEQALLFDTGPAFRNGGNAAEMVVLPFLRGRGIGQLDRLIVSHGDQDHAGGAQTILTGIEVRKIMVGEALTLPGRPQTQCVAGIKWQTDGIDFSILHPRYDAPWVRNNASCVVEVTAGHYRILLTGDIEAPVEKLLAHRLAFSASDIVLVPHHGSRTSSSDEFVDATGPALAIVSASFGNQWGFPKAEVVGRLRASGAEVLSTATAGAISQRICAGSAPEAAVRERIDFRKYWHDR